MSFYILWYAFVVAVAVAFSSRTLFFILCFIFGVFVEIPSEQNVFIATQLGFSLAKFISTSLGLYWEWTLSCSKIFCILLCSVSLCCSMLLSLLRYIFYREGFWFIFQILWIIKGICYLSTLWSFFWETVLLLLSWYYYWSW